MAQYLVLIYESEEASGQASPEEAGRIMTGHETFGRDHAAVLRGGNALQPTGTATVVRREPGGGFAVTDGPFVETKETLGGYYVIEVDDLDQALAVARQVPAPCGGVEVRATAIPEGGPPGSRTRAVAAPGVVAYVLDCATDRPVGSNWPAMRAAALRVETRRLSGIRLTSNSGDQVFQTSK